MNKLIDSTRILPELDIEGTTFIVDASVLEFREKAAPWNKLDIMCLLFEDESKTLYDMEKKNFYPGDPAPWDIPDHVKYVIIPPIARLDPVGLARCLGLKDDYYLNSQCKGKSETQEEKQVNQLTPLEQNKRSRSFGKRL